VRGSQFAVGVFLEKRITAKLVKLLDRLINSWGSQIRQGHFPSRLFALVGMS